MPLKQITAMCLAALLALPAAAQREPDRVFMMPDLAGGLRWGVGLGNASAWLADGRVTIEARTADSTVCRIASPLAGGGSIIISERRLADTDGSVFKVTAERMPEGTALYWAYGGASAQTDIDSGHDPLTPECCADNVFSVEGSAFTLYYGTSRRLRIVSAIAPQGSDIRLSDARCRKTPAAMFASGKRTDAPALCARLPLVAGQPVYFVVYRQTARADYAVWMLPELHRTGSFVVHSQGGWMKSTPD